MPKSCRREVVAGNMKPVTLVSTVVARTTPSTRHSLRAKHAVQHDEARHDADQADGNMQLDEGGNRQP